jgi:hypothetical protein
MEDERRAGDLPGVPKVNKMPQIYQYFLQTSPSRRYDPETINLEMIMSQSKGTSQWMITNSCRNN